jgi:hypothetical protein
MTMTCETVREELVAYRDGELSERDQQQIAAHLSSCSSCAHEEAELEKITLLFANLDRITPSPDFATNFWHRLEQETKSVQEKSTQKKKTREIWFSHWWHGLRESLTGWQVAPLLAGAASLLIFLGYLLSSPSQTPERKFLVKAPAEVQTAVPDQLAKQPALFVNYKVIADLDRFAHFDEISALDTSSAKTTDIADSDVPPAVLEKPHFFAQYPILQKMEQLKDMEAVLDSPPDKDAQHHG